MAEALLTLLLTGDVMLGRGVDQILAHSVDPRLHEPWVKDAERYVELAEAASGPIRRPVGEGYVWGDALAALDRVGPDLRVINLETSVTTSDAHWPGKGIHYRTHPGNVGVLTAAGIDAAVLANNHVLDWGRPGLAETLETLRGAGVGTVGAGENEEAAAAPLALLPGEADPEGGRVLLFAAAAASSGVPRGWAAGSKRSGVHYLRALGDRQVEALAERIERHRRPGDVVVLSIHWGGNWGYEIPEEQRAFAHRLIDDAGVDLVHGHSSHHVKGLEVYRGRLILYGCGDLLNDYEGIGGHEQYRPDLALLYFPSLDPGTGTLEALRLVPMRVRRMRLERAAPADAEWLRQTLERESEPSGISFALEAGDLVASW